MKKLIYLTLIYWCLISCARVMVVTPIPCDKLNDCKATIKKTFEIQPKTKAPLEIEVTDEYISWVRDEVAYGILSDDITTVSRKNIVYFKDIEELRVVDDNTKRFEIRFKNRASNQDFIIFLYDREYAIQGYSAIKCMIDSAETR